MNPLEQNILDMLPNLSEKAKDKARFILGRKEKVRKKEPIISKQEARAFVLKFLSNNKTYQKTISRNYET